MVKRLADAITDEDFKHWDHELVLVFKARDAKKRAKAALKIAQDNYNVAKTELASLKDNLLTAFESSEDPTL